MNLRRYFKNAAIGSIAAAAIMVSTASDSGKNVRNHFEEISHMPYVSRKIDVTRPAAYVFHEVAGTCKLNQIYFQPGFLNLDYFSEERRDDRVVRVVRDLEEREGGNWIALGVGYQISPNLVLTADHVAKRAEGLKNILDDQVLDIHYSDGTSATGHVVANNEGIDLALIELDQQRVKGHGIRLTTYPINLGSDVELRTINTSDLLYENGVSQENIFLEYGGEYRILESYKGDGVRPGMSGSPLFDEKNRVIGVLIKNGGASFEVSPEGVITSSSDIFLAMKSYQIIEFLDGYCRNGD